MTPFVDRHGKERWRYRKTGQPTYYFKNPPGTKGFKEELEACIAGAPIRPGEGRAVPRSIDDLCSRYYASADFNSGGAEDQHRRRLILESFRADFGRDLVANFSFEHIEAILIQRSKKRQVGKRMVGGRAAAQNLRKQLRRLFNHAKRLLWITSNPVEDADRIKGTKTKGFHTWSEEEIAQFQRRHPLGTKARLALEIILWTGQRRGDARLFGPRHMKRGKINYRQAKSGTDLWLPAARQLMEAIEAMPSVGIESYIVTQYGKPFTRAGFGNWFRDRCNEAGLPQCSAHGLRKAIARRMAEMGASNQGIKAVGGWKNDSEVTTYTAAADQERMAEATLGKLSAQDLANRADRLANLPQQGNDNAQ